MRLHGYCTSCRRVRLVSVSAHALALSQVTGVVEGNCQECEEKERPALRRVK